MTNEQLRWRKRSQILWRMKGHYIPYDSFPRILTTKEQKLINEINLLVKEFNNNARHSSEELGFHTHKRCPICGRIISDDMEYCKKHN